MARSRNIKPGFFKNPEVAEVSFPARLLFIALWTLADREGRLEDRPKKIYMEAFPGDSVDVVELLSELEGVGLIERYEAEGKRCIWIPNFTKHQSPHHKEPPSVLPTPPSPRQVSDKPETSPSAAALIPDSGFLNPESLHVSDGKPSYADEFEQDIQPWYPKRAGGYNWPKALKAYIARRKEGHSLEEIQAGTVRYAAFCEATGKLKTEFVKQAATFFGPDKHFLEAWEVPDAANQHDSPADRVRRANGL